MPVGEEDVRHVAELARLGLDPGRVEQLVRELNGILAHMERLAAVDTASASIEPLAAPALPLRPDDLAPIPLERRREAWAPMMRDGFFLVPRLATHEDTGDAA
jgi:aspartyl-tRNA(Asn)/glutamyl-tRNA(Gln) amidotransferase subunit C